MRLTAPLMIVLLAVLLYAAREQVLLPLTGSQTATTSVPESDSLPADTAPGPEPAQVVAAGSMESTAPRQPHAATVVATRTGTAPVTGKIRRNSSLYVELTGVGVSPADVDRVARASKKTYNLRRVRPGQEFAAWLAPTGDLDSLALEINVEQRLKVCRVEGNTFRARMESIPFTLTYHVTRGRIESSIFASLVEQGAETELAAALDEIFGWTIDFISDTRKDDTYTILYERRTYEDGRSSLGDVLAARVVNQGNEHYAFLYEPAGQSLGYYDLDGKSLQKSLRRSPLKYTRVTSSFSTRRYHPVYKTYRPHYGVDYGAPRGTPVYSTGDGVVLAATRYRGNGNYVKVKHNNTYTTYYLHLNGFARGIRSGVRVKQGQLIGYVGSTGAATAPHVCYRIKRNGSWVNARRLNLPSKDPVPKKEMAAYIAQRDSYLFRIQQSILGGLENKTIAVEQPVPPADDPANTLF